MIVVVGSINLDLIASVERLPGRGETVPGSAFATAPGGKGANQALAARRAGADVRMVGAVGRDAFAGEALALLDGAGIDLSTVRRVDGPTGTALILVGSDGENMIAVVPGANGMVSEADVAASGLGKGDHLLLQHEVPLETVAAALGRARSVGAVSILNTAPFHASAAPLLPRADFVIANETEFNLYADALKLAAGDRPKRMRAFVERTGGVLVVTLGGEGALAATPEGDFNVPALNVTPVDTVGAGDTFCGYLAAGLDAGMTFEYALRRAAAAGSLACLKPGAQPAIPLASEVDAALASA
ncbi:MAG: ribokinase [Rhizobiaceae bacterium]|nr:ribokinase [Rhizobiaceae bacterium]